MAAAMAGAQTQQQPDRAAPPADEQQSGFPVVVNETCGWLCYAASASSFVSLISSQSTNRPARRQPQSSPPTKMTVTDNAPAQPTLCAPSSQLLLPTSITCLASELPSRAPPASLLTPLPSLCSLLAQTSSSGERARRVAFFLWFVFVQCWKTETNVALAAAPLFPTAYPMPASTSASTMQAEAAIEAVVARFYERLLPKPRMGELFFANTPMDRRVKSSSFSGTRVAPCG